jgi:hypothetical protein
MDRSRPWTVDRWMRGMVVAKIMTLADHCMRHPKDIQALIKFRTYKWFVKQRGASYESLLPIDKRCIDEKLYKKLTYLRDHQYRELTKCL